jgi:hypothetical protein
LVLSFEFLQNPESDNNEYTHNNSQNGQRVVTAIGLPVISNDNLAARMPNRSRLPGDRVHTSHGNRRASNQKTVKRIQGKGFAIMNEIEVNLTLQLSYPFSKYVVS